MIERIVIRAGLTAVIGPNIVGQRAGGRRLGVARPRGDRPWNFDGGIISPEVPPPNRESLKSASSKAP